MVATRLSLLSLAAASSGMLGLYGEEVRGGRFERRQVNKVIPDVVPAQPAMMTPGQTPTGWLSGETTGAEPPDDFYPPDFADGTISSWMAGTPKTLNPKPSSMEIVPAATPIMPPPEAPLTSFTPTVARTRGPPLVSSFPAAPSPSGGSEEGRVADIIHGEPITDDLFDEHPHPVMLQTVTDDDDIITAPTGIVPVSLTQSGPLSLPSNGPESRPTPVGNGTAGRPNATMTAAWQTKDGPGVTMCDALDLLKPSTSYSILYTATVTFTGVPADYTPYPPEATPEPTCIDPAHATPVKLTMSRCETRGNLATDVTCELMTTSTYISYSDTPLITPARSMAPTIVIVTAKNPSVVYSPISTPVYGGTPPKQQDGHGAPNGPPNGPPPMKTPDYGAPPPQDTGIALAVQPHGVVIGGQTFIDNAATPTQVVTVEGNAFTIKPNEVVGAGATVNRPAAVGGVWVPTPTSTNLGGLPVILSGSVAVIDGTTFTIPMTPSMAIVKGETVSLGPNGVAVASQTIAVTTSPLPTQIFVAGGEVVTAMGRSLFVADLKTITYGPGSSSIMDFDSDILTVGPSGVTVHASIMGGASADVDEIDYAIVGGATLTEIGASILVIVGVTYTVGPGTGTTTTVVGGETITIWPGGVAISTMTWPYPFGPTTTIRPTPGSTATAALAAATSKDAGANVRPDWFLSAFLTCIAIGVRVFGILL